MSVLLAIGLSDVIHVTILRTCEHIDHRRDTSESVILAWAFPTQAGKDAHCSLLLVSSSGI